MTDETPTPPPLPPTGSASSLPGSTPPPPPPPMPPSVAAAMASAAKSEPAAASTEAAAAGPAGGRRRRSLVFGLVALLAVAGIAGGVIVGTGGGDPSENSSSDDPGAAVNDTITPVATTPEPAPTTTAAPTTTEATTTTAVPTTTEAPETTLPEATYPTLPDGSPVPIIAIFNGPEVQIAGWVPSEAKAEQLEALALANSTDPNARIVGELQIDPMVPLNMGTRVIEMNSPRFGTGSAVVTPEHGVQLDRVASVMGMLPHVTVTVVGHSDQKGNEAANYVLSEERAVSVVRYLVGKGVDPSRLSARAVGDQDLLSEENSEAALALNRRTEFIFYGLLAD